MISLPILLLSLVRIALCLTLLLVLCGAILGVVLVAGLVRMGVSCCLGMLCLAVLFADYCVARLALDGAGGVWVFCNGDIVRHCE